MNIVLFEQDELDGMYAVLERTDERARHIRKVLKKTTGDLFTAGIIDGPAGQAVIESAENGRIVCCFSPSGELPPPLEPVDVLVGFPRPIQLRRLLREAASLGARAIHLCGTELGEKSYMESNCIKDGTARCALLEGVVQSRATALPELTLHTTVTEALTVVAGYSYGAKILLDTEECAGPLLDADWTQVFSDLPAILAIGSERGWTAGERTAFKAAGFESRSLGGRVLRTETAVTAALAVSLSALANPYRICNY